MTYEDQLLLGLVGLNCMLIDEEYAEWKDEISMFLRTIFNDLVKVNLREEPYV